MYVGVILRGKRFFSTNLYVGSNYTPFTAQIPAWSNLSPHKYWTVFRGPFGFFLVLFAHFLKPLGPPPPSKK